ncbi:MAG: prepilin peptidase [Thermoleophilaceae bacterium]|nr:prepilin peptidase [Thermoleophilaceae bacterium]
MLVLIGVLGAAIGSFLNVVIHRVPLEESIVSPGSRCPHCGHAVRSVDNIPVLSWLILRGRCRDCSSPISVRYPAVELLTAICFVAIAVIDGIDLDLLLELPFVAMLIAVAFIDLDHRIIPNRIVYPIIVYALAMTAIVAPDQLVEGLIAGAGAFLFLFVMAVAYPSGMGMGDVKLAGAMGLFLGLSVLPAMLAAFLFGSLVGVGLLIRHGSEARKRQVPFGPFLALGSLVGLLAGPALIELYASRFL